MNVDIYAYVWIKVKNHHKFKEPPFNSPHPSVWPNIMTLSDKALWGSHPHVVIYLLARVPLKCDLGSPLVETHREFILIYSYKH